MKNKQSEFGVIASGTGQVFMDPDKARDFSRKKIKEDVGQVDIHEKGGSGPYSRRRLYRHRRFRCQPDPPRGGTRDRPPESSKTVLPSEWEREPRVQRADRRLRQSQLHRDRRLQCSEGTSSRPRGRQRLRLFLLADDGHNPAGQTPLR